METGGKVFGGSSQDLDTWFITMVMISPLSTGVPKWPRNGGDPNYLLSGLTVQVAPNL